MKKNRAVQVIVVLLITIATLFLCGILATLLWPQTDIAPAEIKTSDMPVKVLIASRSSQFKEAVIKKIEEIYGNDSVYIKVTGIRQLHTEDAGKYNAVILLNTCMAGRMDRIVSSFLKKNPAKTKIVVLTTSGDGVWLPGNCSSFDAVASASKVDNVQAIAENIVKKIR
jgi:hypothetical protein